MGFLSSVAVTTLLRLIAGQRLPDFFFAQLLLRAAPPLLRARRRNKCRTIPLSGSVASSSRGASGRGIVKQNLAHAVQAKDPVTRQPRSGGMRVCVCVSVCGVVGATARTAQRARPL